MLRVRKDVDFERLREFGFKPGTEWERERFLDGCNYMLPWWHKCSMEEDNPERVAYADEDYDQPIIHICVKENGELYADFTPSCTYHIEDSEVDMALETVYEMTCAGILEII